MNVVVNYQENCPRTGQRFGYCRCEDCRPDLHWLNTAATQTVLPTQHVIPLTTACTTTGLTTRWP